MTDIKKPRSSSMMKAAVPAPLGARGQDQKAIDGAMNDFVMALCHDPSHFIRGFSDLLVKVAAYQMADTNAEEFKFEAEGSCCSKFPKGIKIKVRAKVVR